MSCHRLTLITVLVVAGLLAGPVWGQEYSEYGNPLVPLTIKGIPLVVELVTTPEKQYLGLSHRPGLPEGRGMLFIFPTANVQTFCMRDMRFAIDIIWIDGGKVAGIHPNLSPQDQGSFPSPVPVPLVLEVAAGFVHRHGIAVGDPVKVDLPTP
jgi:uncharacterized membrane protein (UPF0127 family)